VSGEAESGNPGEEPDKEKPDVGGIEKCTRGGQKLAFPPSPKILPSCA